MTFITPVGRPLYEGVVSQQEAQGATGAPAKSAPQDNARQRDTVTLSPAARAYLESVQAKPAPERPREEPKPQVDETA